MTDGQTDGMDTRRSVTR